MPSLKTLIAICCFLLCSNILAQNWYEIEVLIFEHTYNPFEDPEDAERWPSNINVEWPEPLMELDNPPDLEEAEAVVEDEFAVPDPFVELPSDQLRLSNANYAMRVRDGYRLLWHKSWKAPLLPEESAPWIMIQAGEQIGEHYRLEGGIRIHLARFLHLHSDLWLTELQPLEAEEQTEFHWSQLPKPTITQWPCIFIEEAWPDELRELPDDFYEKPAPGDWYYPFGCGAEMPLAAGEEAPTEGDMLLDTPLALPAELTQSADFLSQSDTSDATGNQVADEEPQAHEEPQIEAEEKPNFFGVQLFGNTQQTAQSAPILTSQAEPELAEEALDAEPEEQLYGGYPVQEIIQIQSQRRMRSEELHYIDHPKIGILAIIHPVEQPILEAKPIEYISAPLPGTSVGQP